MDGLHVGFVDNVTETDRRRKISSARSGNAPRTFLELGDLNGKAGRTLKHRCYAFE